MTMMKKLLAICLLAISFASCEKKDTDKHCWICKWEEKTMDDNGVVTTRKDDSASYCYMTEDQIKNIENQQKARVELEKTYSDTKCYQNDPQK